eukprot:s2201_g2.t1
MIICACRLISLHMENHHWDEAFQLSKLHPEYSAQIYLPWAEWLSFNDRFDDALDVPPRAAALPREMGSWE